MNVKELIQRLQECNPEAEVRIALLKKYRPVGTRPITSVEPYFDQDTSKVTYIIEVNTEFEYPETKEKIIIPDNEKDIDYDSSKKD